MLAALTDLRASEDPQDQALISLVERIHRRRPPPAARPRCGHARAARSRRTPSGSAANRCAGRWPLAARAAHELRDTAAVGELLALLDAYQPGHLAPMLRAERDLARARLAASRRRPEAAAAAFAAAIGGLRELSTPYHLAHGLLDHAEYLTRHADPATAALAIGEARDIARRLRCQPLLDRADALERAQLRIRG